MFQSFKSRGRRNFEGKQRDRRTDTTLQLLSNDRSFKIQGWSKSKTLDNVGEKQLRSAFFTLSNYRKHHKKELEKALVESQGDHDRTREALSDYRNRIKDATVTPKRMIDLLNKNRSKKNPSSWSGRYEEESKSTILFKDGKEMGRFLHGEESFEKKKRQPKGLERELYVKRWDGLKGNEKGKKKKEYIKDDFGNFARRYAYRNDTDGFLQQLKNERIVGKGRHFRERYSADPQSEPKFGQVSVSEMELMGRLPKNHDESGRRFREHYKATTDGLALSKLDGMSEEERQSFGKRLLTEEETVSDGQGLFLHQYWGNQNSQRGFALTNTGRGIVGNYGEGFGYQRDNQKRKKIQIDLARVPKRNEGEAPMLFNYDSSVQGHRQVMVPNKLFSSDGERVPYSQEQFESSTTKNRELFLKNLTRKYVVDWDVPMKPLDMLPGLKQD